MNLTGQPVYTKGKKRNSRATPPVPTTPLMHAAHLKGTDRQYLDWLKTQPSAIDGGKDYDPDSGTGYCDPCHYRTASNSGTGCKPQYSAIPLTHAQHLEQHRVGQFAFRPRAWWERQCELHLRRWIEA